MECQRAQTSSGRVLGGPTSHMLILPCASSAQLARADTNFACQTRHMLTCSFECCHVRRLEMESHISPQRGVSECDPASSGRCVSTWRWPVLIYWPRLTRSPPCPAHSYRVCIEQLLTVNVWCALCVYPTFPHMTAGGCTRCYRRLLISR